MKNKIGILLVFIASSFLFSCNSNVIFDKNKQIENSVWKSSDIVKFTVPIADSVQPYNFYINLRNSTDYQYSNIFLFIKTFYPNGKISIDTVECYLADNNGKWLGKRSGRVVDNRILFRKAVQFTHAGTYSFEFEQAMRIDDLAGIEDFGIRIEKFESKE
ncbi:MAG: gliding motility lipoprotein GldH [Bacteroidota bacterium]